MINDNMNLNINLPLLEGVLGRISNQNGKDNNVPQEKTIESELVKKYTLDLIKDQAKIKSFNLISTPLIKMGFPPKQVIHSFLVYKYSTINEAIEILSEVNRKSNHKYIESDGEKCFICDKQEIYHIREQIENNINNKEIYQRVKSKKDIQLETQQLLQKSNNLIDIYNNKDDNLCAICFEELDNNNKFSLQCNHIFCKECVIEYLKEEIKNSRVLNITCPQKECKTAFTKDILQNLLDEEYMYKYNKYLQREKLKNNPDLVPCPIVNCEGYANKTEADNNKENSDSNKVNTNVKNRLIQEDENSISLKVISKKRKKYICNIGHPFCSLCNKAWHGDTDCEEDKEIKDFATYSGFIVKKCPKCHVWTEKNEGCNHMTCKLCEYNWCWLCEQECPSDHFLKEGTPCYGKQFDGDNDIENIRFQEYIMNSNQFFIGTFIIYIVTFYAIKRTVSAMYHRNEDEEDNSRPSKIFIFSIFTFIISFAFIFLFIFNGFLLISCAINFKYPRQNGCARCFMLMTYLIVFFMFYVTGGPLLNVLWFVSTISYFGIRLIIA